MKNSSPKKEKSLKKRGEFSVKLLKEKNGFELWFDNVLEKGVIKSIRETSEENLLPIGHLVYTWNALTGDNIGVDEIEKNYLAE